MPMSSPKITRMFGRCAVGAAGRCCACAVSTKTADHMVETASIAARTTLLLTALYTLQLFMVLLLTKNQALHMAMAVELFRQGDRNRVGPRSSTQNGHARFGSLADISHCTRHVCFGSKADIAVQDWQVLRVVSCALST